MHGDRAVYNLLPIERALHTSALAQVHSATHMR